MSKILATIDLGSNSFHMQVSELLVGGNLKVLCRQKQKVQLRAGLDDKNHLDEATQQKALSCLTEFASTMRVYKVTHISIVGTYTLRKMANKDDFLTRANEIIGEPIRVLSGDEEAQMIFVGATAVANDYKDNQYLLVDIGGGSTELIIGQGDQILQLTSLDMGCVSSQVDYFANDQLTKSQFEAAISGAKTILSPILQKYSSTGWDVALGASGTVRTIFNVLTEHFGQEVITLAGMDQLEANLIEAKTVKNISLKGLRPDRLSILPGGYAVLRAIFDALNLKSMGLSVGALREGILYQLAERVKQEVGEVG